MGQNQHAEDTAAFIRSLREKALEKHRRGPIIPSNLTGARERLAEHRRLMSQLAGGLPLPPTTRSAQPAAPYQLADPPDPEERARTARDSRSIIEQLSEEPETAAASGTEGPQAGGTAMEMIAELIAAPVAESIEDSEEVESGWRPVGLYRNVEILDATFTDRTEYPPMDCRPEEVFEQVEVVTLCATVETVSPTAERETEADGTVQPALHCIAPLPLKKRQRVEPAAAPAATTYADLPTLEEVEEPMVGFAMGSNGSTECSGQSGRGGRPLPKFATLDAFDMDAEEELVEMVQEEAAAPRMKVTMTRSKKRSFWPFGSQQD